MKKERMKEISKEERKETNCGNIGFSPNRHQHVRVRVSSYNLCANINW
jgi:hypothetical protein